MLTPEYFKRAGIFEFSSISNLLLKIERTGNSSEVDDMVLASVISTHLLFDQFIEKKHERFQEGLNNLKIINDL